MESMEKYQFIYDTVIKYNTGQNPSYEEINTAFSYFHELTATNQYPDDGLNPRIIGPTLADALKKQQVINHTQYKTHIEYSQYNRIH